MCTRRRVLYNQKSQETVYKGVEQASTNIQMIGNVYGLAATPASGINEIRFSIGLAPGAPSVDLTKMKIVFSTPTSSPVTLAQVLPHQHQNSQPS